jgi:hypothetical protein
MSYLLNERIKQIFLTCKSAITYTHLLHICVGLCRIAAMKQHTSTSDELIKRHKTRASYQLLGRGSDMCVRCFVVVLLRLCMHYFIASCQSKKKLARRQERVGICVTVLEEYIMKREFSILFIFWCVCP